MKINTTSMHSVQAQVSPFASFLIFHSLSSVDGCAHEAEKEDTMAQVRHTHIEGNKLVITHDKARGKHCQLHCP